jgi:limonene-1,2-epoxide hydrolase
MGAEQEEVALRFLAFASGEEQDVDAMIGMMSEDVSWQPNVPCTPRVGRKAARAEFEQQNATSTGLLPTSRITNIASNDRAVFVERIDVFKQGGKEVTLHINGVLEIEDGKVVAWREYFDLAHLASQLDIDVRHFVMGLRPDSAAS